MTTIIEREPVADSSGALAIVVVVLLVAIGLAVAYYNGAFKSSTNTIENNRTTIEKTTVVDPTPASEPAAPAN